MSITIASLQEINTLRAARWHKDGIDEWSPLEWAGAMCGEAGEAANFAKKLKRIESHMQNRDARLTTELALSAQSGMYRKGIANEVADAVIYGVLLCARVDESLEDAVRDVFNAKSEEYGFPERL